MTMTTMNYCCLMTMIIITITHCFTNYFITYFRESFIISIVAIFNPPIITFLYSSIMHCLLYQPISHCLSCHLIHQNYSAYPQPFFWNQDSLLSSMALYPYSMPSLSVPYTSLCGWGDIYRRLRFDINKYNDQILNIVDNELFLIAIIFDSFFCFVQIKKK